MATTRRVGTEKSKTRAVLLDSAVRLMLEQGYAAVSYRSLAAKAGVTAGLVQYYFPTFDDLFVALVRDRSARTLKKLEKGLRGERPLHAIWEYANNKDAAALTAELTAAANHRKPIRAELAQAGEEARARALAAVARTAEKQRLLGEEVSADVMVFLLTSLPRMVIMEQSTGMTTSHAETMAFLEAFLARVEPDEPGEPDEGDAGEGA
ncbi:TetR/AcrR family transcriptional regulator [Yinghuangia sp. ASG 101]|uniref:TetR/AcrR family transcriptional regulator n=1 Tax=Yinghuangia sp. ASG 101 TaxID=2896848 RepID=UPI001E3E6D5C|nr:TetR/AcrR family transcriptional regulator [Yinghuangia sp. ASG 101]UGQ12353.1 TetR/AcrR family transcriptional regulator [Yinghuangia sp. ASG 101]